MPGTGTGTDGRAALVMYGDRVEPLVSWADDSRGEGTLGWWVDIVVSCGNGNDDPRLGVGGKEGDDSEEDGTDGEEGDDRPPGWEVERGKAVEMARGMEWPYAGPELRVGRDRAAVPVRLDTVGLESCVASVGGRGGGLAEAGLALRPLGLEERERGGSWTEYCSIVELTS